MVNTSVFVIFDALEKFINARPDLDPANYGLGRGQTPDRKQWFECRRVWQAERRSITQDGTRARKALREARSYPENATVLAEAFKRAFSGRLEWVEVDHDFESFHTPHVCRLCSTPKKEHPASHLEYCTGQYYPTEYRKAAAAVLEYYCHESRPKFKPPTGTVFTHISQIKQASYNAGSHWFDKSTVRFFSSQILPQVFHGQGGVYFVSSEKGPNGIRAYTVRQFNPIDADIDTFGPFNELSRERALRIAKIAADYPEAAKESLAS
jgi:hypothetical protein